MDCVKEDMSKKSEYSDDIWWTGIEQENTLRRPHLTWDKGKIMMNFWLLFLIFCLSSLFYWYTLSSQVSSNGHAALHPSFSSNHLAGEEASWCATDPGSFDSCLLCPQRSPGLYLRLEITHVLCLPWVRNYAISSACNNLIYVSVPNV